MKKIKVFFLNRFALNAYITNDFNKALKWYEKIFQISPDEPGLMHNIGLCYFSLNDYKRAEPFLLDDMDTYGETGDRLRTLGDLYYRWKRRVQALMYYNRLKEYQGHAENWLIRRIGILKNEKEADLAFSAADSLEEALVKMKDKQVADATRLLEQGAKQDPSSFQIINNLGVIALKEENDPVKAVAYFEQAEELMPLAMHKANLNKAKSRMNGRRTE